MKRYPLIVLAACTVIFWANSPARAASSTTYSWVGSLGGGVSGYAIASGLDVRCNATIYLTGVGAGAPLSGTGYFAFGSNALTFVDHGGGLYSTNVGSYPSCTSGGGAGADSMNYFSYSDNTEYGSAGTITTIAPTAISFTTPTNGSTLSTDFYKWGLNLTGVTTTQQYRVDVEYQAFGGTTEYDDFNIVTPTYPDAIVGNTHAFILDGASSTSYVATAYLTTNTSTDYFIPDTDPGSVLASTTITFTIGVTSSTPTSTPPLITPCGPVEPFFQLTGSLPYFKLGNPIDSVIRGGCVVLASGFVMTQDQYDDITSRYNTAATIFSTKPPFGYFVLVANAIGSFSSGSSTIYLLDASSTAAFAPLITPIDEGLAAGIGLLGIFWIQRRMKHVQP